MGPITDRQAIFFNSQQVITSLIRGFLVSLVTTFGDITVNPELPWCTEIGSTVSNQPSFDKSRLSHLFYLQLHRYFLPRPNSTFQGIRCRKISRCKNGCYTYSPFKLQIFLIFLYSSFDGLIGFVYTNFSLISSVYF